MDPSLLQIPSRFVKYDAAMGLILGFAIVCKEDGKPYTDLHGDHIPETSMVEAAAEYMLKSRASNDAHGKARDGDTVFAFPYTQDTADALDLGVQVRKSGLLVGMIPSAAVLAKVERGEYTGLSIGGIRVVDEPGEASDETTKSLVEAFVKSWSPAPADLAKAAKRRNVMRKFRIHEISPVPRPAQEGAKIAPFMKWIGDAETPHAGCVLTTDVEGHAHLIHATEAAGETSYATAEGEEYGHVHPWVRADDGSVKIGASAGHTHEIRTTKGAPAAPPPPLKENAMDPKDQEIANLKATEATLRGELAKALRVASLTDAQRAHAARLSAPEAEAFVAKSAPEREAEVVKAAEANPVLYTDVATGNVIRKSDDPTGMLVTVLKSRDEMATRLAAEATAREDAEFAKEAGETLGNLPGTAEVKIATLRQIGRISDAEVRKAAKEMITAANAAMAKNYQRTGAGGAPVTPADGGADAKLEAKVHEVAKAKGLSFEKAYGEVLDTAEGARLYADAEAAKRNDRVRA